MTTGTEKPKLRGSRAPASLLRAEEEPSGLGGASLLQKGPREMEVFEEPKLEVPF